MVQIGQKVYTGLYNKGFGVVYNIHGEQKKETVRRLFDGVGMMGGKAEFDIVFYGGSLTARLPECILYGVQWTLYDEVVGQDVIDELLVKANKLAQEKKEEAARQEEAFNQAVAALKVNSEYGYLSQDFQGKKSHIVVAGNVRAMLKMHFPSIKFSVKSEFSSIRVCWTDGPTGGAVDELLKPFEEGRFNGMEDIYEYNASPWNKVFGGIQYIFTNRHCSDDAVGRAIDALCKKYPSNITEAPTVKDYRSGKLRFVHCGLSHDLESMIYQEMVAM